MQLAVMVGSVGDMMGSGTLMTSTHQWSLVEGVEKVDVGIERGHRIRRDRGHRRSPGGTEIPSEEAEVLCVLKEVVSPGWKGSCTPERRTSRRVA